MRIAVIITAAGMGTRLGWNMPKALVPLAGRTLIERALEGVRDSGIANQIIVTIPAGTYDHFHRLVGDGVKLVVGGATRQESVAHGLDAVRSGTDIILVHDAARCMTPAQVFRRVAEAVSAGHPGVIPAIPVTDTIKSVETGNDIEPVLTTFDRSTLRAVQTPQGFDAQVLRSAHEMTWPGAEGAPDDGALVEASGHEVVLVKGADLSMKITTELDMKLAELLLGSGSWT